ncbi:MAG: recombinase family protein [Bacteroidia bacterium]|nr:recombinase family protein [Bacteroidia bacterium]
MTMNDKLKKFAKGKFQEQEEAGGYCIIYNRVSSKEQLDGQSLNTQMEKCEQYAEKLGMTVLERFGGTFESAKSDKERKEFSKMIAYLNNSRIPIKAVIVYSTSRFSRTGSTTIIEEVEKRGAQVRSATSNYDPKTAQGKFIQNMELATARLDNDIKRNTTIDNSIAALRKGRWIAKAPRGYDQKTTKKEQVITINEEGEKIKLAFDWKVNQNLSNEEIRIKLEKLGFIINKQKLSELFKNPFYAGYMSHNFLKGEIIKGNHPAIVSEDIFLKANGLLDISHSNGYEVKMYKPEVPLLGSIKCPICRRNMTASISTKMKKKYDKEIYYYVCWNKGCKQNNAAKNIHQSYKDILNSYGLSSELTELLKIQMKKTFSYMTKNDSEQLTLLKRKLSSVEGYIKQVEDNLAFANNQRQVEACTRKLADLENEKEIIETELQKVNDMSLNLPKYIDYGLKYRNNMLKIWELADLGEKKRIQKVIHPMGFVFNKEVGNIEPLSINQFVSLRCCKPNEYDQKEKETINQNDQLSLCVPEAGLEPAQP